MEYNCVRLITKHQVNRQLFVNGSSFKIAYTSDKTWINGLCCVEAVGASAVKTIKVNMLIFIGG